VKDFEMSKSLLYVALSRLESLDQLQVYGITREVLAEFVVQTNPQVEAHAAEFERRAGMQCRLAYDCALAIPRLPGDVCADIFEAAWERRLASPTLRHGSTTATEMH
jgi:hypothetical protein